jgi:hypothetical protein
VRDHVATMTDERPSDVLGGLPRTRPHRRSDKRATRPDQAKPAAAVSPEAVDAVQAAVAAGDSTVARPGAKPKPPVAAKVTKAKPAASARARPKPKAAGVGRPAKAPSASPAKSASASTARTAPTVAKPADAARAKIAAPPARPAKSRRNDVLTTAVQAAAELAEIGLTASARAIRRAVSRLPRP